MAKAEAAAGQTFDASSLEPREMVYGIVFQGNEVGQMVTRWERDGDAFAVISEQQAPGMTVTTTTEFEAMTFAPLRSAISAGPMGEFEMAIEDGRATGMGFDPQSGPKEVDVEVPEGTALADQFEVALAMHDFDDAGELTLNVLTSAGSIQQMSANVTGEETVEVPAGTFETYRVEMGGETPMTVWVTKADPHVVVKRELAGQPVTIELKSM